MVYVIRAIFTAALLNLLCIHSLKSEPRNVLIEYVTGTWCGNCPCGHQALNTISAQNPSTILIAYHAFSNDPFRNFNGNNIVNLMGFSGTPTADIDRISFLGNSNYPLWISTTQSRYESSPNAKVRITVASKSYNEITGEFILNADITALEILSGQYKINFVITENNLLYQQNYYASCGTPGYVQDYIHNNVARNMVNGAEGENLNAGNVWNSNQTFPKSISAIIDPQWNAGNCKLVIFVYKQESALNLSEIQQAEEVNITGTIGVLTNNSEVPEKYALYQNYPNPFNPSTTVKFTTPSDGNVKFSLYDILGNEVQTYVNGFLRKGSYSVQIDGSGLSSGIYLYKLESKNFSAAKRMLLVK